VRSDPAAPVTLGITGASGAPYALRILRELNESGTAVRLIVSSYGWRLLQEESGIRGVDALRDATGNWERVEYYQPADRGGTPASGSAPSRGMVVCPCSMGTLACIAAGTSRSLIERAADVALKERRPLILVPRETPLSLIHLENMVRVTRAGATVLPASPGFYHEPRTIDDLVGFVVARVLDHLEVPHSIGRRYSSGGRRLGAPEGSEA
jgi:flavin prenyltransferase